MIVWVTSKKKLNVPIDFVKDNRDPPSCGQIASSLGFIIAN